MADHWGWHAVSASELRSVHRKLSDFETMTWQEILVRANRQNHHVEISSLCGKAQTRLDQIGYGDLESLVSLRLSGAERVWGVMHEGILTLLWWDPNHEVCPSLLKHT